MLFQSPRQLQTLLLFNLVAIILLGGALIAIASIFFTDSEFIAFSNNENSAEKSLDFHDTYLIPCTNKTEGDEIREFDGKTIIASNCQQSINVCLVNICKADRTCEEFLIENATCSQDADCDPLYKCDLDLCSCVKSPFCVADSDCIVINNTDCAEATCENFTCVINTIAGMECSTPSDCGENEYCGNDCTCIASNSCEVDSDCQTDIANNTCADVTCETVGSTKKCVIGTKPASICSTNQDCGVSNEYCAADCECKGINECLEDSDCFSATNNNCTEQICISGVCTTQTIPGNECSEDQECASNEYCSAGCVCRGINSCIEDSDCFNATNNNCTEQICISGVCTTQTIPGNECSTNQECLTGQYCAPGCSCVFVNSTSGTCETNEDCDDVNSTSCANFTCVMGKCTFGTIDGNECSTAQDCGMDEFCGFGCVCVSSGSSSNFTGGWAVTGDYTSSTTFSSSSTTTLSLANFEKGGLDFVDVVTNQFNFTVSGNYFIDYSIIWGSDSGLSGSTLTLTVRKNLGNIMGAGSGYIASGTSQFTTSSRTFKVDAISGDLIDFRLNVQVADGRLVGTATGQYGFITTIRNVEN